MPGAGGITGSGGCRLARGTNAPRPRTPVTTTSHPSTPRRGATSSDEGPGIRAGPAPRGLAQEFAHRAPARVRRLVLAATSFGLGALPGKPRALIKLANPFRYHAPGHLERIAPTIYGGGIEGHPELLERFAETLRKRPPSTRGFLWQLVAAAGWTSLPWLRRIPHPTLVVAGDRDPIVPLVNARLMARLIPEAHLYVVRGGGHLFLLTHAGEVASVIRDFLRASGPASGEAPGA